MANSRKQARREKAEQRNQEAASRTPTEQLKRLDEKLGKGVGAKKERVRLQNKIDKGINTMIEKRK